MTDNERVLRVFKQLVEVEGQPHPTIHFLKDDEDAFPDGVWEIRENLWDVDAVERSWRGLTLADALTRAEAVLGLG